MSLNSALSYSQPEEIVTGTYNFVSYKTQKTSYGASENFSIKLSSNSQFLDLSKSYMKLDLATSTSGNLAPQGASAVFASLQDTVSGLSLPICQNWNVMRNVQLQSSTYERKKIQETCEQWTGTGTGVAVSSEFSKSICMPIPTSVVTDRFIPLCLFNSGHEISYSTAIDSAVVTAGTYTISNIEIVCALVTPTADYLQRVSGGIASGEILKLPLKLYKSLPIAVGAATTQTLTVNCGYLSSLNSLTLVHKATAASRVNLQEIKDFYIQIDGQRFPTNKTIDCANSVESVYQTIASGSTSNNAFVPANSNQTFVHFNWASEGFSGGIATSNGSIQLETNWSSTPTSNSILFTFVSHDSLLLVGQDGCNILNKV